MKDFSLRIRIYYEDTDAGGIVYNANYVKYLERARTEWLRSGGVEQDELLRQDVAFVVRHLDLEFLSPARFNELIDVTCSVMKPGAASVVFAQSVFAADGRELVRAKVKIACVSLSAMKPVLIPEKVKEVFINGSKSDYGDSGR